MPALKALFAPETAAALEADGWEAYNVSGYKSIVLSKWGNPLEVQTDKIAIVEVRQHYVQVSVYVRPEEETVTQWWWEAFDASDYVALYTTNGDQEEMVADLLAR